MSPRLQLPLLGLLLLCLARLGCAQFGTDESAISYEDFPFPEYAQPWSVGQQVCAYLKTQSGKRIYTTCFPYKQQICGKDTSFEYDCCPGYGHDKGYEGYATSALWPYKENCLKKLGPSELASSNDAQLKRIGADDQTIGRVKRDIARYSGQVTAFLPYKATYKSARYNANAGSTTGYIAKGSFYAKHLLDQTAVPTAAGDGAIKITRYSNGIICAECRRFVSADHSVDGRAVVHFVDGFVFPSSQTLGQLLSSKYAYFWSDVPAKLKAELGDANCARWYTVLVPSQSAWTAARNRAGTDWSREKLLREHVLSQLVCSAAVCQSSQFNKNLNDENVKLACEGEGKIYAQSTHEFIDNEKAYLVPKEGELDQMASNGVLYETDKALSHSAAFSYLDIKWPDVPNSCITLDPAKKYIFLIPRETAWTRFKTQDAPISSEETMKKFSDWYARDAEYRCLVRQYHVLEAGNDQVSLDKLWSQYNPSTWPVDGSGYQPGSFRTLARWAAGSSADARRRNGYGYLRNQLHFQKSDTNPRLHFQFAPVRDAGGFQLKEGWGYMVDWVNIPPHESARDFFERRTDLKSHLSLLKKEEVEAKGRGSKGGLYSTESTVQLIIVSKDTWYNKLLTGDKIKGIDNFIALIRNTWNVTDFLRINWGSLYYWVGPLGFLAKGEKVYIQSGHPEVLIGVYRHFQNGKFYTWNEMKGASETLQQVQSRWMEVVEFNHFKTDAIIWIVDKPQLCTQRLCKMNLHDGRTSLPWTFAAACGDFVSLKAIGAEPLKTLFTAAGGDIGRVLTVAVNSTIESGEEKGKVKPVPCFAVGMVATRTIVFRNVTIGLN